MLSARTLVILAVLAGTTAGAEEPELSGAAAVADAVLWGVLAGRKEQPARASLRPSLSLGPDGGAAVLSGAF